MPPSSSYSSTAAVLAAVAAAAAGLSAVAATRIVQRYVHVSVYVIKQSSRRPIPSPTHPTTTHPSTRRRRQRVIQALLSNDGNKPEPEPCIGLAVDVGSSSVRCSAYVLKPCGRAVAVPGTMAQVVRDALDPATGTADAEKVLADVEAVVDGCLGYVGCRLCLLRA